MRAQKYLLAPAEDLHQEKAMKKQLIWNILLIVGIVPFLLPFIIGFYRMSIESWTMFDWLVLYSFIYWPTYVVGAVAIAVSVIGRLVRKK